MILTFGMHTLIPFLFVPKFKSAHPFLTRIKYRLLLLELIHMNLQNQDFLSAKNYLKYPIALNSFRALFLNQIIGFKVIAIIQS